MIWLGLLILTAVALAPLALSLRRAAVARGRREAALALHRAQLVELDRDRDEGRIGPAEHATAVLEVQRRLLAEAAREETAPPRGSREPLIVALIMIPVMAVALYRVGGSPWLPAAPLAARIAAGESAARDEAQLIDQLRTRLAGADPKSEQTARGYELLGNAEASRGNMAEAADAWRHVLAVRFDPTLAVETAEAITETAGHITDEAAALFRRALAEAPPDAPWRPMAEKRLAQAK